MTHCVYSIPYECAEAAVMKNSVIWDIIPYSPLKVSQRCSEMSLTFSGQHSVISQKIELFMLFYFWDSSFVPQMVLKLGGYCKTWISLIFPLCRCSRIWLFVWFGAFNFHFLFCLSFVSLYAFLIFIVNFPVTFHWQNLISAAYTLVVLVLLTRSSQIVCIQEAWDSEIWSWVPWDLNKKKKKTLIFWHKESSKKYHNFCPVWNTKLILF
jgi:hypothetical protein